MYLYQTPVTTSFRSSKDEVLPPESESLEGTPWESRFYKQVRRRRKPDIQLSKRCLSRTKVLRIWTLQHTYLRDWNVSTYLFKRKYARVLTQVRI